MSEMERNLTLIERNVKLVICNVAFATFNVLLVIGLKLGVPRWTKWLVVPAGALWLIGCVLVLAAESTPKEPQA